MASTSSRTACRRLVESGALRSVSSISTICVMPLATELDRHADEQAVDAVLALEVGSAGQDLVAVVEDRVDHLRRRSPPARNRRRRS